MLKLILALILSLAGVLVLGPRVIPVLRKLKFGQTVYELGPQSHKTKQGTPTMGGLMFVLTTCLAAAVFTGNWYGQWDFTLALIGVSLLTMLVGFVDDYIKVVKKRNLGLIWWQKVVAQVVISLAFSWYCYRNPMVGSSVIVPFFNVEWDLGAFYVPLMTLAMIFMVNSANLQDGLDGLLSSVSVIGSSAWGLIAVFVTLAGASALSPEYIGNYQLQPLSRAGIHGRHGQYVHWRGHGGHEHASADAALLAADLLYHVRIFHERHHSAHLFQSDPRQAHFQNVAHSSSFRTERHDRTADRGHVLRCGGSFVPDRSVLPSTELTDSIVFCGFRR